MNDIFRPYTETIQYAMSQFESLAWRFSRKQWRRRLMNGFRFIIVAAGALAIGGALASAPSQAAVQGGADAMRAASENGALTEQTQFRMGGYDYCWADDGWRGPGWYWCGYAY